MRFNSVTWYSKLAALLLFVALPFAGFYAGMRYQEATSSPTTDAVVDSDKNNNNGSDNTWGTLVSSDKLTVETKYEGGKLKYKGTVQTPTPCHTLKDETMVLESFPEQVQIRLTIGYMKPNKPNNIGVCAQIITEKEFSGEVQASSQAVVSVYLDGKLVE